MDRKLANIYYNPKGYWKGLAAIKKLASAAKVSEDISRGWLKKTGYLAGIFTHSTTEVSHWHTERGSPG